jgi:hypothetical protein
VVNYDDVDRFFLRHEFEPKWLQTSPDRVGLATGGTGVRWVAIQIAGRNRNRKFKVSGEAGLIHDLTILNEFMRKDENIGMLKPTK